MPRKPTQKRETLPSGKITIHAKAGNGEGSLYFYRDRWHATYRVAGEKRPRRVSGRTRTEVVARRDEAEASAAALGRPSKFTSATTVGEFAAWWLAVEAEDRYRDRPSSLHAIAGRLTSARLGNLAHVALGDLTVVAVDEWKAELLKTLAPKTVADTREVLRQVIEKAIDANIVTSNAVARSKRPKPVKSEPHALALDDARRLLVECSGRRYGLVVLMPFSTAARVSEALGLAWQDVDLDTGTMTVRRALVQVKGPPLLGAPKTVDALGVHFLAPFVVERLRVWKRLQAAERLRAGSLWQTLTYDGRSIDLVFTQEDGRPVSRQHVSALIHRSATQLGLDRSKLGTHVARRTAATILTDDKWPEGAVQVYLRHSVQQTIASKSYIRSAPDELRREMAGRLAELLDPWSTSPPSLFSAARGR